MVGVEPIKSVTQVSRPHRSPRGGRLRVASPLKPRGVFTSTKMSRRDKIMALAISMTANPSTHIPNPMTDKSNMHGVESPLAIPRDPIVTDLNKLWSRPYDFDDFKPIFDYQNEYCNSCLIVKKIDLSTLKHEALEIATRSSHCSLKCTEVLPLSEEDDEWINRSITAFEDSDDSVKDKDYCPDATIDSDTDLSSTCNDTITSTVITSADIHKETSEQHCELEQVRETSGTNDTIQLEDEIMNSPTVNNQNIDAAVEESLDNARPENELEKDVSVNEKGFTKSGLPRKRKLYDTPASERLKRKKEMDDEKLALKPPCTEKCRKNCTAKFTEEDRKAIHDSYIQLNWESKGLFIKGMVEPHDVKTRTKQTTANMKRKISYTYHFHLKNERVAVCKTFFLATLGYNPQNNTHLHIALSKDISDQKDKRGSYKRKNVIDKNKIKEHIEKFEPTIAHYRREHAPLRRYIPSDVNITMMHQSFMQEYPDIKVSFETYRQVLKDMNISFSTLGHEECEQCTLFKQHTELCTAENCETCIENTQHISRYTKSRKEYQKDKEQAATDKENIYYSMDLQKVIMLPRMEQFKSAIFCPRIIAFNESFVPLGKTTDTNVPYAVVWNETISGRSQEDILSALRSFLIHKRDVRNIVLWADNCSSQNKNWAFMCFLVDIVNSPLIAADSVCIKYFEPGHTFMSADHFHHQVEKSLKKKNKVYDFDDFIDAVKMSNSKKNIVKVMTISDFYSYEDVSSQHKLKNMEPRVYLKNMMVVKAERGSFTIKYKETHDDGDWKDLDFLQVKIKKKQCFPVVQSKSFVRGISMERKQRIIADLVPLMPITRRDFWLNLPESSEVPNLE